MKKSNPYIRRFKSKAKQHHTPTHSYNKVVVERPYDASIRAFIRDFVRYTNALRSNNILRLAQTIQSLMIEGYSNPSQKQMALVSGMSQRTIERNKEAVAIIQFALSFQDNRFNLNVGEFRAHILLYMYPQTPDIRWFAPLTQSQWQYKDKTFTLDNNYLNYEDTTIELPKRTKLSIIEQVCLSVGIPLCNTDDECVLDAQELNVRRILSVLTTISLKNKRLIKSTFSIDKQLEYGKRFFELYHLSKQGSGKIPSTNKNLRWFNENDTLGLKNILFEYSDARYIAGISSMKYKATAKAEHLISDAIAYLPQISFKVNDDLVVAPMDFILAPTLLTSIKFQDLAILLNECIGYKDEGFVIRPVILDRQHSRVYSCFTSISSETRKQLGFINYDIGAALQSICLKLASNPSLYPQHQSLVNNKTAFRKHVMNETGKDLAWVKTELSKIDNQDAGLKKRSKTLQAYYDEALLLRKDVIGHICTTEPLVYNKAYLFAKIDYTKQWDIKAKRYDFIPTGRKESSVFFFIWTQYERQIREAMAQCFKDPQACQHVHDAIYSKEDIDIAIIEKHVLATTGFSVKISH